MKNETLFKIGQPVGIYNLSSLPLIINTNFEIKRYFLNKCILY